MAIIAVFLLLSQFIRSSSVTENAYEVLQQYNFPVGLLPQGIIDYQIDRTTGRFHAYLNGSCSFSLEGSYQLKYKSTISGYIAKDRMTQLSGVSVKVLFLWLNIVEVIRRGDNIDFSVGIASGSFSIDNFYESPQCGCGLNCSVSTLQTKSLYSSI